MDDLDLAALRGEAEATMDPHWVRQYGDEAWKAALAVIGEPDPDPDLVPRVTTGDGGHG